MLYTVKAGDSLSSIARDEVGDINRWPEIAKMNNITNVNLIHPGDVLTLPEWQYTAPDNSTTATTETTTAKPSSTGTAIWGLGLFFVVLGTAAIAIKQHRKKKQRQLAGSPDTEKIQSMKAINSLKMHAVRNGGYSKYRDAIIAACDLHKEKFGVDMTPKQFK